jgi:hypothetical protein
MAGGSFFAGLPAMVAAQSIIVAPDRLLSGASVFAEAIQMLMPVILTVTIEYMARDGHADTGGEGG